MSIDEIFLKPITPAWKVFKFVITNVVSFNNDKNTSTKVSVQKAVLRLGRVMKGANSGLHILTCLALTIIK